MTDDREAGLEESFTDDNEAGLEETFTDESEAGLEDAEASFSIGTDDGLETEEREAGFEDGPAATVGMIGEEAGTGADATDAGSEG